MAAPDSFGPTRTGYLALYNALLALRTNELDRHISRGSFYTQPLPVMIRDMQLLLQSKEPNRKFPQTLRKEEVPKYFKDLLQEVDSATEHDYFGHIERGLRQNNWGNIPLPRGESSQVQMTTSPPPENEQAIVESEQVPVEENLAKDKAEKPRPFRAGSAYPPEQKKNAEQKVEEKKPVSTTNPAPKQLNIFQRARSWLERKPQAAPAPTPAPITKSVRVPITARARQIGSAIGNITAKPFKNIASQAAVQIIRHPIIRTRLLTAGIGALGGSYVGGLPGAGVGGFLGGLLGPQLASSVGNFMTGGRGAGFSGGNNGSGGRSPGGGSRIGNQARNIASNLARQAARRAALVAGRAAAGFLAANAWWIILVIIVVIILLIVLLMLLCILPMSSCSGGSGITDLTKQITIQKSAPQQVENGASIEYKITVSNKGKTSASVVVSDDIPADTVYESGDNDPVQEGVGVKKIQWDIKNLPANGSKTLTFKVKPQKDNMWIVNQATGNIASGSGSFTPGGQGLLCVDDTDPRLVQFFESAGVSAGVAPAILYGIAKGENGGTIQPWSIDEKQHAISPCGAHGLMQIQHINDGLGRNYGPTCAAIGGTSSPPEVFDGLSSKYNGQSGGNIVDADADKDSIFGAAFYVQDRSWPTGRSVTDQLTDQEVISVSSSYLGALNPTYAQYYLNNYHNAYAKQNTCK